MSAPQPPPWTQFNRIGNIDFRTACNEAVAPPARPLSDDVMRRVSTRRDAEEMFDAFIGKPQWPDSDQVLKWLSDEPRWRTIVAEALAASKQEEDARRFAWDRISKWFSTRVEGQPSPKERAAAVLVASMAATGGAGTTYVTGKALVERVGGANAVSIPVQFEMPKNASPMVVTVQAPSETAAIPVTLTIKADASGATIPIQVVAESTPVTFAPEQFAALERIGTAATRASAALQEAGRAIPQQAQEIKQAIAGIKAFDPATREYLRPLEDRLEGIATALKDNQQPVKELRNLAEKLGYTGQQIELLGGMAATGRTVTSVTAIENQPKTVPAVWLEASGTTKSCKLSVNLGRIRKAVEVKTLEFTCGSGDTQTRFTASVPGGSMRVGDMVRIGALPVAVSVDAIVRPIIGANHAVLRVLTVTGEAAGAAAARPAEQ